MTKKLIGAAAVMLVVTISLAWPVSAQRPAAAPTYSPAGELQRPTDYREWVFLPSGLDMTYQKMDGMADHSMFDNVFAHPSAYREFMKTGTWPDGTLLVKEARGATEKGSINRGGKFQTGEPMDVEVHLKDTRRFAGGWAFFEFGAGRAPVPQIPVAADCYSCHRDHGLVDSTFVQFYPTLLSVAKQRGTAKAED